MSLISGIAEIGGLVSIFSVIALGINYLHKLMFLRSMRERLKHVKRRKGCFNYVKSLIILNKEE